MSDDPRIAALPDIHGHAKGEHKPFAEERPIPYTARMLFLWFYHACRRSSPRFMMVADHINYLTFEDPAAVNLVRRALKLAQAGDLYGAAETAGVELVHAAAVSEGLRKGMRYSIGAEIDNDPRSRPDAQNIVDAMRPDGMIRSVHFLPIAHPQHGENWMWPFDNPEYKEFFETLGTEAVWELYVATLLDAVDKLPGHIVGHFYVPAKFGHWPDDAKLESYEDRLIDACAERGMAIEINSRYFYKYYAGDDAQIERYRTAYLRLLAKAKAKGVMIAVGSDAHSPKDQGGAFDAVLALLDEADINEIAFPINGRLARVALRATEEVLRQHSAALASAAPIERAIPPMHELAPPTDEPPAEETAVAAPVAKPRPKAKPRPQPKPKADVEPIATEVVEVAAIAEETTTLETVDDVAAAVAAAPEPEAAPAPVVAKKRPAKKPPVVVAAPDVAVPEAEPEMAAEPVTEPAPVIAVAASVPPAKVARERKPSAPKPKAAPEPPVKAAAPKKAASAAKPAPQPRPAVKVVAKPAVAKPTAAKPVVAKAKPIASKAPPKKAAPAKKVAAKKVVPKKAASVKAAPAKKAVTKKPLAKKAASAARPVAKKVAPRSAARPAAKPVKKATRASSSTAKSTKRDATPTKRTVAKKPVAKKPAAKKKPARSRR